MLLTAAAQRCRTRCREFLASERGQGLVEYALILTLVSIVAVIILLTQGQQLQNMFSNVSCGISRKPGC
ncbi:MAG: Flp family type IVb pilin [Candidatus Dormibacteraeota bacterium]|nr:Flp family type IVb pilin [Candidatus Dormibacteraeota bacterium]